MLKLVDSYCVPLTRELAEEFYTMPRSLGERDFKQWRVDRLREKYRLGLYHPPTWAYAYVAGTKKRVNGQHSSTMFYEMGDDEFPKDMKVMIHVWHAADDLELATVFAQYDSRDSVRSTPEVYHAHAAAHPLLKGVTPSCVRTGIQGIACYLSVTAGVHLTVEQRSHLSHEYPAFLQWLSNYYSAKTLRLAPATAAMFATWQVDPEDATRFWGIAYEDSAPSPNHPTRVMNRLLTEARVNNVRGAKQRKTVTNEMLYERCIHAWNAYRRGSELQRLVSQKRSDGESIKPI